MKPLPAVFAVSLLVPNAACLVDVPEPDHGSYACSDNRDCADGYWCYFAGLGSGVCVSEEGCTFDAQCGPEERCAADGRVCVPQSLGCAKNEDCPSETPWCDSGGACIDPCATIDCQALVADTVCVVDLAADSGYRCLPCSAEPEACGTDRHCVQSRFSPSHRCAVACPTAGSACSDGGLDGWCSEVMGVVQGGASSMLAVCAVCDPACADATPQCAMSFPTSVAPNIESAVSCQPVGGPCAQDSDCGAGNTCALQSAGGNICASDCSTVETSCDDINNQPGWCVAANTVGGSGLVCASCPETCGSSYESCGSWPNQTNVDQAIGCVCTNDSDCANQNTAAFRCVAGLCTDSCDPTTPPWDVCPQSLVCQDDLVCGLCGNNQTDSGEACDDGGSGGGYCLSDCSGPDCTWALIFKSPNAAAEVLFDPVTEHQMTANGFTIDLWARVNLFPAELVSRSAADGTAPYYRLLAVGNGGIELHVMDASGKMMRAVSATGALTAGKLHRITAVRETDGSARLDVDGSAVATAASGCALDIAPTGGLRLGYFPNGAFPEDLELDSVRVFQQALTTTDLGNLRRCEPSNHAALVGEWLLDLGGAPNGPTGVVDTSGLKVREAALSGNVAFGSVPW